MAVRSGSGGAIDADDWRARSNRDFVAVVFGTDLLLCALRGVLCLLAVVAVVRDGSDDVAAPMLALLAAQWAADAGLALFGIRANLRLRGNDAAGLASGRIAVLLAGAGIVSTLFQYALRDGVPDDGSTCDPAVVAAGMLIGIGLRIGWNAVYWAALARVRVAAACPAP